MDQAKHELSSAELASLLNQPSRGSSGHRQQPFGHSLAPPSSVPVAATGSTVDLTDCRNHFERWATNLQSELSTVLHTEVHVHLSDLDESTYAEFVLRMDNPTCLQILKSSLVPRKSFLELHPTVLFPLIDRMLGGGSRPSQIVRRPLTDIESRLVARLTSRILATFNRTIKSSVDFQFESERVENNPKRQRYAPADDCLVTAQLQLEMDNGAGPIRIGIPADAFCTRNATSSSESRDAANLEDTTRRLTAGPSTAVKTTIADPPQESSTDQGFSHPESEMDDPATVSVIVARTQRTLSLIESLEVGDILTTDVPQGEPAEVLVDSRPQYRASIGNQADHKAVQIIGDYK